MLPVIDEPDLATELDTMTEMYSGTVAGGVELFPGVLLQDPPHDGSGELLALA